MQTGGVGGVPGSGRLVEAVTEALVAAGEAGDWRGAGSLGGSQSAVDLIQAGGRRFVLKHGLPGAMAAAEARGLALLANARAIRVPAVVGWGPDPPFILLEYVVGGRSYDHRELGTALARLHRCLGPAYGLDHDNFIGRTPQQNGWLPDWSRFFALRRLRPQIDLAADKGLLPPGRRRGLEQVTERTGEWIDDPTCQPSLIHGDLWCGNAMAGRAGEPVLIDPAVSYSDREAEISMMRLFGGFDGAVFAAYDAEWPLAPGWREREHLYRLYHLLNHLNLFGESYGSSVDATVRRLLALG